MLVSGLVAHYRELNSYLGELSVVATREAKQKQERTEAFVARSVSILMGVVAASLALGLLATWLIGRAISTPLTDMTRVMSRLAQGDYEISVPAPTTR